MPSNHDKALAAVENTVRALKPNQRLVILVWRKYEQTVEGQSKRYLCEIARDQDDGWYFLSSNNWREQLEDGYSCWECAEMELSDDYNTNDGWYYETIVTDTWSWREWENQTIVRS